LIWNNLNEDGSVNSNTIHQAHPIIKGEKTVITKWFRQASLTLESETNDLNKHIQTYTNDGFKKEQLDEELFKEIKIYLAQHKNNFDDEFVEGNFIQSEEVDVPSRLFELSDELKSKIHNSLQKSLESWSNTKLEPTFVYGIREYKKGAVLVPHRDRKETHIISAIINIDKRVDNDWPLEIEDHFYRKHEVFLEPGEVLFYESARLLHGRPTPLKGESYSNIFCHYMPSS
jgi:prolyl 4-hydroxylase